MGNSQGQQNPDTSRIELCKVYLETLKPFEKKYQFQKIIGNYMNKSEFFYKPMILLIGQFSTGKTTFIKHLIGSEFPGCNIGPEPTTDGFTVVMSGEKQVRIPGAAATVDKRLPFENLQTFGLTFLSRFDLSILPNRVLEQISFIDTPGILSGEKQTTRGYDFNGVITYFSQHASRVILFFDAYKLDISEEFGNSINALIPVSDKLRILLNKADNAHTQQLVKIYGALLWSLARIIKTPEVVKIYVGTFHDGAIANVSMKDYFETEQERLISDLASLPQTRSVTLLNDVIKRARLVRSHAYLINNLRKKKKKHIPKKYDEILDATCSEYELCVGDFPSKETELQFMEKINIKSIKKLKKKEINAINNLLEVTIPRISESMRGETFRIPKKKLIIGHVGNENAVFSENEVGIMLGKSNPSFMKNLKETHYSQFLALNPEQSRISLKQLKQTLLDSHLPNIICDKIWMHCNPKNKPKVDAMQYALACHLRDLALQGHEIPSTLPSHLHIMQ